jgi:hypothetical protein
MPAVRRPRRNASSIWAIRKVPVYSSGVAAKPRPAGMAAAITGCRRPTTTARPSSGTAVMLTHNSGMPGSSGGSDARNTGTVMVSHSSKSAA